MVSDKSGSIPNPSSPFQQLLDFLAANNWPVDQEPGAPIVHTGFDGEHCKFRCAAAIKENPAVVQFFTIFPMEIPAEKLSAVAEFCSLANWQLTLGRFELGWQEKQLRFQTAAPFSGEKLDEEVLKTVVRLNLAAVEYYFEAVTAILFAGTDAAEAVRHVEKGT